MAQKRKKKVAVVQCLGGSCTQTELPRESYGADCVQAAAEHLEGVLKCRWGCIGLGSCVSACRLGALHIGSRGTAEADWEKCVGCGMCVKTCPMHLIRLTEPEYNIYPACANENAGAETRKECRTGCIACGICVKACPMQAIGIVDNHAVIDEEKCIVCGMCAVKCPRGVIRDQNGILTVQ